MKKIFAILLIAAMTMLGFAALAEETYIRDDITFAYDADAFEISMDDHTDDEDLIILTGKNEAWGETFIRIYLNDLDDGETFPTMEEFTPLADVEVTQGEWNGFKDVFMYTMENEDGSTESVFVAPVIDEDGEIEDLLSVNIGVSPIEDDDVAMGRDDLISAVLGSLKIDD